MLNENNSLVCTARTGDQGKEDHLENVSVSYTELINLTNCEKHDYYSVAYIARPREIYDIAYERLSLLEVTDTVKRKELNEKVQKTNVLRTLLDQNAGVVGLYKLNVFRNSLPQVLQYPMPGSKIYILTYDLNGEWNNKPPTGPRAVIINDLVQGLTGQCSYGEIRAFKAVGSYLH